MEDPVTAASTEAHESAQPLDATTDVVAGMAGHEIVDLIGQDQEGNFILFWLIFFYPASTFLFLSVDYVLIFSLRCAPSFDRS